MIILIRADNHPEDVNQDYRESQNLQATSGFIFLVAQPGKNVYGKGYHQYFGLVGRGNVLGGYTQSGT